MKKESDSDEDREDDFSSSDPVEAQISMFAVKIGQETGNKFFVYIYRIVRNEETGRMDRPFLRRYNGVEPDPQEIAEKFRGGKYLVTFTWKFGKQQKSKSYTLDIDSEAFPPIPKDGSSNSLAALSVNNGMSDAMKLQVIMMQTIGEVMKESYKNNGNQQAQIAADPVEQFSGMLQSMEHNYASLMQVQSKMFERVLSKNMEIKYGLDSQESASMQGAETDSGILSKYAPLLQEIVTGLKTVFSVFGDRVPKEVIRKVQGDERFKELRANPRALVAVGQTLRKEFGDSKAADIMKSFGVVMKIKPAEISNTPDIPGIPHKEPAKINVIRKGGNGKVVSSAVQKRPVSAALVNSGG